MSESKVEKKILYFVIIILIWILLILIFGMLISISNFSVDKEMLSPLSTFFGALFGAGISGGVAIYVMRRDITSRREEKLEEKNNNFKKSFELIAMWSSSHLHGLDTIYKYAKSNSGTKKNSIEIELNAMEECKINFDKINDDYIPQKVYKEFLDLKICVELSYSQYKSYYSTIELFYADNEPLVISDDEVVKKWVLETHEEIKRRFTNHLEVLQDYRNQLEE